VKPVQTIQILTVSRWDDELLDIMTAFTSKEKAERFVHIQKGIYFPWKVWKLVECELVSESDRDADKIYTLVVSTVDDEPTDILISFESERRADEFIEEQKEANTFPYVSYEIIESELH
jgi:hypothetical protein